MNLINKSTIEKLAELARIELSKKEEESLQKDLGKILAHFEELKEVKADNVRPIVGGYFLKNVLRLDDDDECLSADIAVAEFPEKEKLFLRVPPVFSTEGGSASRQRRGSPQAAGGEE